MSERSRSKTFLNWQFLLGFLMCFILLSATLSYALEIHQIQEAIRNKGGRWVAEENPISLLPREEFIKSLGALDEPDNGIPVDESFYTPLAVPSQFDWRNVGGANYVTPIRSQGSCGSCWAFATTAALESKVLITLNWPGTNLDLSEQIVLSCSSGGTCDGGYTNVAADFLTTVGTSSETCYPYSAANGNCGSACANWRNSAYRIASWSYVVNGSTASVTALKNAIYTSGPIVVSMKTFDDLRSYRRGVYSHITGNEVGGHAVLVVGWDDSEEAFIVKNSWGASWGESGYFRIDYSELAGDTRFGYRSLEFGNAIPPQTSNLTPYQPSGWSDAIVVSTSTGTNVDSGPLYPTDTLYVDWAVLNNGFASTPTGFSVALYVDGALKATFSANPLSPNYYAYYSDYSIGSLGAGTHTVQIIADSRGAINESNEGDNQYTKTVVVNELIGPDLTGEWISLYQTCKSSSAGPKCKLTGSLAVYNAGNQNASSSYTDFYATVDFNNFVFVKRVKTGSIRVGAIKFLKFTYTLPVGYTASDAFIVAWIDGDGVLPELNEDNNFPYAGPIP